MKNHIFAAMLLAFFGTVAKAGDFKIDISHYAKAGCELPSMEKGAVEYQDIIKNSTCRSKNHPFQSFLFKKHQYGQICSAANLHANTVQTLLGQRGHEDQRLAPLRTLRRVGLRRL